MQETVEQKIIYVTYTPSQRAACHKYYEKNRASLLQKKKEYIARVKDTEHFKMIRRAAAKRHTEKRKAERAAAKEAAKNEPVKTVEAVQPVKAVEAVQPVSEQVAAPINETEKTLNREIEQAMMITDEIIFNS